MCSFCNQSTTSQVKLSIFHALSERAWLSRLSLDAASAAQIDAQRGVGTFLRSRLGGRHTTWPTASSSSPSQLALRIPVPALGAWPKPTTRIVPHRRRAEFVTLIPKVKKVRPGQTARGTSRFAVPEPNPSKLSSRIAPIQVASTTSATARARAFMKMTGQFARRDRPSRKRSA